MKIYQNYLNEYSQGLMGYAAIAIIGQSCLGSIATMYTLMNGNAFPQMFQLFIITILCMLYNGAILSQQKAKWSFNLLLISIITSIIVIIINVV